MIINGKEYITTAEAGKKLKVSQVRVRQLVKEGILTDTVRLPGRLLVEMSQVRAYNRNRVKAGRPSTKTPE